MRSPIKVLLVPGDRGVAEASADAFHGIEVLCLEPASVIANLTTGCTVLFIDWLLPNMAGLQLLNSVLTRRPASQLHITMVIKEPDEALFSRAILAGADDYMAGPLTAEKLIERIGLYLPDLGRAGQAITLGDLYVDPSSYVVRWRKRSVSLQGNELRLMIHFATYPNRVFSRAALQSILGQPQSPARERAIDVWISRLRHRLRQAGAPSLLRTVREFGYVLDLDMVMADERPTVDDHLSHGGIGPSEELMLPAAAAIGHVGR